MAMSCVVFDISSPTASGPVFSSAGRTRETSRKPKDYIAAEDEEYYGCFEQSGVVAFTWSEPKRYSSK